MSLVSSTSNVGRQFGGVTYYSSYDSCPVQTGSSGQAVFTPQPTNINPPSSFCPSGIVPYPVGGVMGDEKLHRPIMPQHPGSVDNPHDYYVHGKYLVVSLAFTIGLARIHKIFCEVSRLVLWFHNL